VGLFWERWGIILQNGWDSDNLIRL
jgi:hypothetical protein